jgi:hypothetical protein
MKFKNMQSETVHYLWMQKYMVTLKDKQKIWGSVWIIISKGGYKEIEMGLDTGNSIYIYMSVCIFYLYISIYVWIYMWYMYVCI